MNQINTLICCIKRNISTIRYCGGSFQVHRLSLVKAQISICFSSCLVGCDTHTEQTSSNSRISLTNNCSISTNSVDSRFTRYVECINRQSTIHTGKSKVLVVYLTQQYITSLHINHLIIILSNGL